MSESLAVFKFVTIYPYPCVLSVFQFVFFPSRENLNESKFNTVDCRIDRKSLFDIYETVNGVPQ